MIVPSLGNIGPCVLDLEVVPPLGYERFGDGERDESQNPSGGPKPASRRNDQYDFLLTMVGYSLVI